MEKLVTTDVHTAHAFEELDIQVTVNGDVISARIPVDELLIDLLRTRLGLTGTKLSCASEVCGACSVLVDGQPVSACTYLAFETHGHVVTTVEGLAHGEELSPLQEAFVRNVGGQCGYCTPGQLIAATALLKAQPSPTYAEIARWMNGNTCRCGCYSAIAQSIREVAAKS